jgi:hypothetical protein
MTASDAVVAVFPDAFSQVDIDQQLAGGSGVRQNGTE